MLCDGILYINVIAKIPSQLMQPSQEAYDSKHVLEQTVGLKLL